MILFVGGVDTAHAQSALDGYDPNANGIIRTVVVQPDGKVLIGGDFTALSPNTGSAVTRNGIARLNADGTLDTAFNPNASAEVAALAVQADGSILAGGSFTSIGGQSRNFIARLNSVTGAADSFNPNADSDVASLAVQPDGRILAGGDFANIGGQARNRLARLDPATGLADSFNPNADNTVDVIALEGSRGILVGGVFNNIGGQARHHLARLDFATGLPDSFAPNSNGPIYAIAFQADCKILVGGAFFGSSSIGGQSRNYIARVDPATGLADSFNPNANGQINAIAVQTDGKMIVGGNFTGSSSIGGQARSRLARLDPSTGLADSFNPGASGPVLAIAIQPDGKSVAAGQFLTMSPNGGTAVARSHIARLETSGLLDQTFPAIFGTGNIPAYGVNVAALQPDGKLLIAGPNTSFARYNGDGTIDSAFSPSVNSFVDAVAVQPDGKVLIGGSFSSVTPTGGTAVTRNGIARLNADGTLDTGFDPNASSSVYTIIVQADGRILVSGAFAHIGGLARSSIARLDPVTGQPDSFNPSPNLTATTLAVQANGEVLAGGYFTSIGGQSRNYLARLDPTSGAADSFNPGPATVRAGLLILPDGRVLNGGGSQGAGGFSRLSPTTGTPDLNVATNDTVQTFALQANGYFFFGGRFNQLSNHAGYVYNFLVRLDSSGNDNPSYDPAPMYSAGSMQPVNAITIQADGKVLVGGSFFGVGGQTRTDIGRLSADVAALQTLTITPSAIVWTLGGSFPQFERVTFESSTDNVTYTSLGNGLASGSAWTLSGLSLPMAQNIYVRARGYESSGDGSESIIESVRNAFLVNLKITSVTHPANGHIVLNGAGVPSAAHSILASPDLSSDSFTFIGTATADSSGALQYDDAGAAGQNKRFYRLSYP